MFYLYFSFSLISASLLLKAYIQKKSSLWPVVAVLFAPVTTPYFFFQANPESRLKKRVVLTAVFYLCFVIVCAGEFCFFPQGKDRLAMDRYSPVERQTFRLSEELTASTRALDEAIKKFESLGKVMSKRMALGETLSLIGIVRVKMVRNRNDVERFTAFVQVYRAQLETEELQDFLLVGDFFSNPIVKAHYQSLDDCLDALESLLNYVFDNYDLIDAKRSLQLKNYDAYYLKYRRSVDRYNSFCTQRTALQKTFLEKHPDRKLYLPTMIQTDFFKVWK